MASSSAGRPTSSSWDSKKTTIAVASAAGLAVAAYLAYSAYQQPPASDIPSSSSSSRAQPAPSFVTRLRATVSNYVTAIAAGSGALATLATDMQSFLTSDINEVPQSLRQLAKLVQSSEVQASLRTCAQTVTHGAATALPSGGPSALDTILEAVLSERGRSLVGLAVSVATQNATSTLCEYMQRMQEQQQQRDSPSGLDLAVQVLSSDNGEKLLSLLITRSIRTSISAYVDATAGYNMYDDMVHSITKQEHRDAVTDIMTRVTASFCKEVAGAYRKATMQPANQRPHVGVQERAERANSFSSAPAWDDSSRSGSIDGETASCCMGSGPPAPARMMGGQPPLPLPPGKVRSLGNLSAVKQNAPKSAVPGWVKQVADLAKEKDVRTLVVDVTSSATREATRGVVETLVSSCRLDAVGARLVSADALPIYILLSILLALMVFVLSPPASIVV